MASPTKLYSYAAVGIPIVTTEGPDDAEYFEKKGSAMVVREGEDFSIPIREIILDREKRQRMSQSALEIAKSSSWEQRVDDYVEFMVNVVLDRFECSPISQLSC
jgi:glycosyltransferase involved in cell wall biosynthesis